MNLYQGLRAFGAAALVRQHFFRDKATGKLFFLPASHAVPEALAQVAESQLDPMAPHPQIRSQLEKGAFPTAASLSSGPIEEAGGRNLAIELLSDPAILAAFFSTPTDRDYTRLFFGKPARYPRGVSSRVARIPKPRDHCRRGE